MRILILILGFKGLINWKSAWKLLVHFFFAFASVRWNNKTQVKASVDSIVPGIVQITKFGWHKPRDGAFVYRNERRPVFCFNLKLLRKWNPFAPGNFAPKTHFKARRTILQSQNDQNAVYRSSNLRPSSTFCSRCRKQTFVTINNLSLSLFHLFRFSRPLLFLSLDIYYASFR